MKKLFAILLAAMMVLSMTTIAFASDDASESPTPTGDGEEAGGDGQGTTVTYTDAGTVTITKKYVNANGGVSPAEEFGFTAFTQDSIKDNAAATWPATLPTITSVTYAEGAATADGTGTGTATATITLPTFTAVGVYTYKFKEATPTTKTAGVTYNGTDLYLVVTVIEQSGKVRVAAVHCEGNTTAEGKTDAFTNTYESGTLAVSKTVKGNMGDKTQYFDVTVTFAAPSGEQIKSTIKYSGGKYAETVLDRNSITLQVKDGDTVTFTNIPEGVTYTVVEDAKYAGTEETTEYTNGYKAAEYANSDNSTKTTGSGAIAAGDADTVGITNEKETEIDTGIVLDSLPYILIGAVAMVAAVVMIAKKRRVED